MKELQVSKDIKLSIINKEFKRLNYKDLELDFIHVALRQQEYENETFNFLVFYADVKHVFENFYELCELEIKSKKQLNKITNFMKVHDYKEFETNYVYKEG